jgi:hypothetical protein
MQNIGFVEKSDNDKLDLVKFLVDSAKGINTIEINKEDSMTDEIMNEVPAEEVAETEAVEIAPEADAEVEEVAVEAETEDVATEEVVTEEVTEEVADEEVSGSEEETVNAVTELKDAVTSAFSEITAVVKSLADEVAALKKSTDVANAKLADAEGDFNNLGKRIDAVEADTAFRKSGDLGQIVQEPAMVEKSVWGGRFLTTSDLLK